MFKSIVFACFITVAWAAASDNIKFTDCGHHEVSAMQFTGCSASDSFCKVFKGKDMIWSTQFTANQNSATAKLQLFANVGGIELEAPGIQSNACDGLVKCPLVKGEKYSLTYKLNLPTLYPNIHTSVIAKLTGDNGQLICGKLTGELS